MFSKYGPDNSSAIDIDAVGYDTTSPALSALHKQIVDFSATTAKRQLYEGAKLTCGAGLLCVTTVHFRIAFSP